MRIRNLVLKAERWISGTDDRYEGRVVLRMALVLAILIGGFAGVVAQAAVFQIGQQDVFQKRAARVSLGRMPLHGRRGDIVDRTGRRTVAISIPDHEAVYRDAPAWVDRVELSYYLAETLELDPEVVRRKILNAKRYALIKRNLSDSEIATLRRLDLKGVNIETRDRRFYPLEHAFGNVIGYMTQPFNEQERLAHGDGLVARAGIERLHDGMLQPGKRNVRILRDPHGNHFFSGATGDDWDLDGWDLVLTIDAQIQMALDEILVRHVEAEGALGAMAVVLDARTSQVLAMSSVPTLDPNKFAQTCAKVVKDSTPDDGSSPCTNKVLRYSFEPGSVGKILTAAIGFDAKKLNPQTIVRGHGGHCRIGKFRIRDVSAMGDVTYKEAFKRSSNCAHIDALDRIGSHEMYEGLKRLGIGRSTGIDLPGERIGYLPSDRAWSLTVARTASYGYGYRANLLQLATVTAAAVNNGVFRAPRVAMEYRSTSGDRSIPVPAGTEERRMSASAASMVRDVMRAGVMDERASGKQARPDGYTAAGKTGTARMPDPAGRGYDNKRYFCSFVGYAPAEDPDIVVAVTIIDPRVNQTGGSAAAPIFRKVVEASLPAMGRMPEPELRTAGRASR